MGPRGHLVPRARVLRDPAPPLSGPNWGPERALRGGEGHACWVAGAALRPLCLLGSANKATFRDQFRGGWSIRRIRLSWRWGRERKPEMAGTGPGSGGAAKSPSPGCREGWPARLSPGFCLLIPLPLLYNLSVNVCIDGVPVAVWWPMIRVLGDGACQQPPSQPSSFEDLFLFPVS